MSATEGLRHARQTLAKPEPPAGHVSSKLVRNFSKELLLKYALHEALGRNGGLVLGLLGSVRSIFKLVALIAFS